MKLLLASNGGFLTDQRYDLLGIPKDQIRIAWVTTASKGVDDKTYLENHAQAMREKGFVFEEIDIGGKNERELREAFAGKNVVHIEGGNTFYLLKAVRESGFDKILRELLEQGVVYVGTSAGAYIVCPTIEMSTWRTDQHPTYGVTDLTGLNLIPFLLKVHYKDGQEDLMKEKIKTASCPVRILRDGQGILVENGNYTFVGKGEEVTL